MGCIEIVVVRLVELIACACVYIWGWDDYIVI
jgi:hypothetical protein